MGASGGRWIKKAGFVPDGADGEAGTGHALAEAAFPEKFLFEFPQLLVEQIRNRRAGG